MTFERSVFERASENIIANKNDRIVELEQENASLRREVEAHREAWKTARDRFYGSEKYYRQQGRGLNTYVEDMADAYGRAIEEMESIESDILARHGVNLRPGKEG